MGSTIHDSLLYQMGSIELSLPEHTRATDAHQGDLPGDRGAMASVTETGSDSTVPKAWAGQSATQLLKASHCLLPPGCVLGCARSSFQMLLSSAPLWSETSHTEQEASHGQRLSHIPIPLCPFSSMDFLVLKEGRTVFKSLPTF